MDSGLPPTSVQEAVLSAVFHSTLLNILLLGIYTTVYLGTMYIYLTKKPSQSTMVVTAISLLYLLNVAETGVQWFTLKTEFITGGTTRGTAYAAVFQTQLSWQLLLDDIFAAIVCVVADGLLIWRCYNVWGKSFRVIFLSLVLVVAETALYLSVIIIVGIGNWGSSKNAGRTLNILTGAAFFMTFGATLLTTVLIAYRILSVTRRDPRKGATRAYKVIAEALVQSAAAYSLVALFNALIATVPQDKTNAITIFCVSYYPAAVFLVIAGMTPTIMVACVAMQASGQAEHTRTAHISDLEFWGHSSPSGYTTQILSQGIRVQVGGRDDISTEDRDSEDRDSEKRRPTEALVEEA